MKSLFFAREDFQRALLDRRFVEEEVLHTAVDEQGYEPRRSLMFLKDGGITPVNDYLPPVNEEGYCVLEIPRSLLDNKTPEEVLFENNYSAEAE